jgi:DnaJ-domain-containing protein 1
MAIKDRLMRAVRSNLNDMLDRVQEFEDEGGIKSILEDVLAGREPEALGTGEPELEGEDDRDYSPPRSGDEKTIEDYYANLEVSVGADRETVKESYRRLMKRYHPDRFDANPDMQELATELSQELTRAYREVMAHLDEQ